MRPHAIARRSRFLPIGAPAVVLGALAGTLVAAPASAEAAPLPVERLQGSPTRIATAEAPPASYTVQPGDTVSAIANRFGLRTTDVLAWNALTWRSVIYPGQSLALIGTAPAAAAPAPAPQPTAATHVVVAGDTVFGIAGKHGTTVDAILAANGLTRASVIYPGQTLALSGASAAAPVAAPAPQPVASQVVSGAASHVVVAGDTIFAIAKKYATTASALFALNGLSSASIIYPGQSIVVSAPPPVAAASAPPQLSASLDGEQAANAALIISIGRQLGVSDRGVAIALATAMVESGMRNLDWGDRDSLGLFQQRPSTGWGEPEQILNADRSARVFYGGQSDPNGQSSRGLLDISGWEGMAFTDAAQAVQISAYPDRYGQWETQAYQWLALHG
ncbi:LysM peptidoglycan-binding domain-containing protein [Microbacterium sp. SD291]|uniref:LysM peptidoglycan-binding domain-containing protein n=1 Tax=Microbacterium sp. SD291 TaxID=2782007 RepID=UPI001A95EFC1|nr:LysM peptidoglycan-binding domain-containing protein [Microbacterium sp. SD291]MBO0979770.1 LysM peptidoglycan-binding domain-containing protein [Microbacterium sp. SD291]